MRGNAQQSMVKNIFIVASVINGGGGGGAAGFACHGHRMETPPALLMDFLD
jgi:hypothetical protein